MKIRFTREELDALNGKARRAGLSRESYCRHILNGAEVKEAPPADVPTLIREVRRVGCNIDQLLVIARAKNWMIAKDLEKRWNAVGRSGSWSWTLTPSLYYKSRHGRVGKNFP